MFGLSDAILGLTVLAWGNSIGDLIADTAMAKRGNPRTGFSACFGGPLFNLLLGKVFFVENFIFFYYFLMFHCWLRFFILKYPNKILPFKIIKFEENIKFITQKKNMLFDRKIKFVLYN